MQAWARKAIGSLNHDGTLKRLQSGGMLLVGAPQGAVEGTENSMVPGNVEKRVAMTAWARRPTSSVGCTKVGMRLAARVVRFGNSGGADRDRALWPCLLEGFCHAKAGERAADDSAPSCSTATTECCRGAALHGSPFRSIGRPEREASPEHQAPGKFRGKEDGALWMRWRDDSPTASRTAQN